MDKVISTSFHKETIFNPPLKIVEMLTVLRHFLQCGNLEKKLVQEGILPIFSITFASILKVEIKLLIYSEI